MIVQENFLKKLRSAFDLNIYEVKIWTALLSRGMATAGELSDISDVPRSRSYDVLESLEKKGFVIMKLGRPIKYLAVEPKEILKRVKNMIKVNTDKKIEALDKVKQDIIFRDIELLYKQGIKHIDINELSGAIKGRVSIYDHLKSMLEKAEKSVVIVTSSSGLARKVNILKSTLKRLSNKGVKIRIAAPLTKDSLKVVNEINDIADVRDLGKINARFILVDNKELMFMVSDDKVHESYDTGVWVNTPYFANALGDLFESNWKELAKIK